MLALRLCLGWDGMDSFGDDVRSGDFSEEDLCALRLVDV